MAQRTISLTENELKVFESALESYRKIKSAERMLRGQAFKAKDRDKRDDTYAKYDRLLDVVKQLQEKIQEP